LGIDCTLCAQPRCAVNICGPPRKGGWGGCVRGHLHVSRPLPAPADSEMGPPCPHQAYLTMISASSSVVKPVTGQCHCQQKRPTQQQGSQFYQCTGGWREHIARWTPSARSRGAQKEQPHGLWLPPVLSPQAASSCLMPYVFQSAVRQLLLWCHKRRPWHSQYNRTESCAAAQCTTTAWPRWPVAGNAVLWLRGQCAKKTESGMLGSSARSVWLQAMLMPQVLS
jgi:hypothetical protein